MQRLIAIILLSCLHLQPAVNVSVWIDFLANNDYIKEVLCINKERPKLNCDGKCYLMQQLQENQPEQEQELPRFIHSKYEFVFLSFEESLEKTKFHQITKPPFSTIVDCYSHMMQWEIFHPPRG